MTLNYGGGGYGRRRFNMRWIIAIVIALVSIVGYLSKKQVNPITGEKQYVSMTPDQEKALGLQAAPEMISQMGGEVDPSRDPRYAALNASQLPLTESLKDTVARFLPYWHATIAPSIQSGKRVVVAAHGNSLRALVKYLDDVAESEIVELNIPTGIPLVYELDAQLKPLRHYYLGDPAAAAAAAARVANQAKQS